MFDGVIKFSICQYIYLITKKFDVNDVGFCNYINFNIIMNQLEEKEMGNILNWR